ncbi:MAG TPA: M28 family peptidase [Bryobacteraceae bacterium]|nr:M28 family peptidase [Bryobacteraceae bacterium]
MMKLRVAGGVALLATLAAAQTEPTIEQLSNRLAPNDLKADVSFLASDLLQGRGTPSSGLDIAAEYIAAQFRRAGLEPAGDDGYFQTALCEKIIPITEGTEFTLETAHGTVRAQPKSMGQVRLGAIDLSHSPILKVLVPDIAALKALRSEDVQGRVLVMDRSVSKSVIGTAGYELAASLRPALVVVLNTRFNMAAMNKEELTCNTSSSTSGVPILAVWDSSILSAFDAGNPGSKDVSLTVHIPGPKVMPGKARNVLGVLRGSDPALRNTYALVTAHYDHLGVRMTEQGDSIYNGANDDASGAASVIEIANALAAQSPRPKRSIVFMTFFGEELGLVGSRYYTAHPMLPLAQTLADFNLENLGRTDADGGSRGMVDVTGYDFSTLTDVIGKAGEATGLRVVKDEKLNTPFYERSDNQSLADAGVVAHTLSIGFEFPDYHKPGDEWQRLDYDNMAKVARTVALAVWRVANSTETPEWKGDVPDTERYIKARQIGLGKK